MAISSVGSGLTTLQPAKLQSMSAQTNAKIVAGAPVNSASIASIGTQTQTAMPKPASSISNGLSLEVVVSLQSISSLASAVSTINAAKSSYDDTAFIDRQGAANAAKIDALNSGLGSLVDADMAKETAMLTALKTRQNIGTQALSIANQAPTSLLGLFRG